MTIYRRPQTKRLNQPNGKITPPAQSDFIHLYEVKNLSRKELASHYQVHKSTIDNWCKLFGVKKSKSQQVDLAMRNTDQSQREGYYSEKLFTEKEHLKSLSGIFYIIRLYNNVEVFYKIGITKSSVRDRYRGRIKHYQYEIVAEEKMCLYDAYLLERQYKQSYRHLLYTPFHRFHGHTECYISHAPLTQANVCAPSVMSVCSYSASLAQSISLGIFANNASYVALSQS